MASCDLDRFSILEDIYKKSKNIELTDFINDRLELENQIIELEQNLDIIPFNVNLNSSLTESSNTNDLRNFSNNENYGIEGVLDINLSKLNQQKKILNIKLKILQNNIDQIKNKETNAILVTKIEIIESFLLKNIYINQENIYKSKLEYFEILLKAGEARHEEMAETRIAINELKNKILALTIKIEEKLFYLGLDQLDGEYDNLDFNFSKNKNIISCELDSFEIKNINYQIDLSKTNLQLYKLHNELNSQLSLNYDSYRKNNTYNDEISLSLSLSLPLYQGGKDISEINALNREINLLENQIIRKRQETNNLIYQRNKTETVLEISLMNIHQEKKDLVKSIDELFARKSMGQSVFLELANKNLEAYKLEEVEIRLKSDYLVGWVNHLGKINGYN